MGLEKRRVMVLVVALFALAACVGEPLTNETTTSTTIAMAATSPESEIDSGSLRGTIVYSTDIAGNDDVFLVTPPDGEPVQLTKGPEKEFDPDLSPDGASIAYRVNPDPESDEADIWVMDLDGGNKRNLTNSPQLSNWAPAWTPDGEIVFSSMRGGSGALELWSMTADGSDLRQVSEGWCEYPDVSPDGSEFVCSTAVGGRYDLLVVDGATGARRALTTTPETEFGPTWSPDGQWIVFSRDTGEHWELLRIRPDGSDEEHIAKEGVFATWDPDGHLVWSGEGGINIARVDGSGLVVLDYPAGFMSWGESGSLFPGFDLAGDRRRVEPGVLVFDQAISEVE